MILRIKNAQNHKVREEVSFLNRGTLLAIVEGSISITEAGAEVPLNLPFDPAVEVVEISKD